MKPYTYHPSHVMDPQEAFRVLWAELAWQRIDKTPRREYYCTEEGVSYTYGAKEFARTYEPQPWHPMILEIKESVEAFTNEKFEVCFLNGYQDGKDQLGWHADDSPEMDDQRPIAIVSLGAEREIWFRDNETREVDKILLGNGSLCLMGEGMQDTHQHRIPKSHLNVCGPRISLTFRGYVNP